MEDLKFPELNVKSKISRCGEIRKIGDISERENEVILFRPHLLLVFKDMG